MKPRENVFQCVPAAPVRFDPSALLDRGVATSSFSRHLDRKPDPSKNPGVDVDVAYATEGLSVGNRPLVRSPVTGTVVAVKPNPWGRVSIRDSSGYVHHLMHVEIGDTPLIQPGDRISKGDPVGRLGRVAPASAKITAHHVHYSVEGSQLFDPEKAWYDPVSGAVVSEDDRLPEQKCTGPKFEEVRERDKLAEILHRLEEMREKLDRMCRDEKPKQDPFATP